MKKKTNKNNMIPVYLCGTDARYHIPGDAAGVRVYFSESCLRERSPCCSHGCGITRLILDCSDPFIVEPEDWEKMKASSITLEEAMRRDLVRSYKAIWYSIVKAFIVTKRHFRWASKRTNKLKVFTKVPKHIK